ncbi:MAG: tetratricopeptide repeat protein [Rhodanobacteraceae bacterium]
MLELLLAVVALGATAVALWLYVHDAAPSATSAPAQEVRAGPSATRGDRPPPRSLPAAADVLAPVFEAEKIVDPMQRCLAYPTPRGYHWPQALIAARCADVLAPRLEWETLSSAIEGGKGTELDARLDALVDGYFAKSVPEGALQHAYVDNFSTSSPTVKRLIDQWLIQAPASAHALTARGIYWLATAQEARGEDTIQNTPAENLSNMSKALDAAQRDLEKAISINPRVMPAYTALIGVAKLASDRELAERTIRQAIQVDPTTFYPRDRLSIMYEPRWGGSFEEMDRLAADAMPLLDENPRLIDLKVNALAARGLPFHWASDYPAALREFDKGLAEGPDYFYLDLAQNAAGKTNDSVRAVELLSQILRFAPDDMSARRSRAYYLARIGRDDWATSDLDFALRANPRDAKTLRTVADLLIHKGDNDAAQDKLKELIAADPTDRWAKVTLAWMYQHRTHRIAEATALVDEMLKEEPESGELWQMRVQLFDAKPGPGMRDAIENFLRYADTNDQDQRNMIPIAKNWLATHPAQKAQP